METKTVSFTRWKQIEGDTIAKILVTKAIELRTTKPWTCLTEAVLAHHYLGVNDPETIAKNLSCRVITVKRALRKLKPFTKKYPLDGWAEYYKQGKLVWRIRCPQMVDKMIYRLKLWGVTLKDITDYA